MYLLDTDILSNLARPRPSASLLARLAATSPDRRFTSAVTVAELLFGALLLGPPGTQLMARIERGSLAGFAVLPFDEAAARRFALLRADLQRRGELIGDMDAQIAAIALVHGLTVVSGNLRHFSRVPDLEVENWL